MIAIYTKYLPATNTTPSRIKAFTLASGQSATVPYDHNLSGEMVHFEAVKAFAAKHLAYAPSLDQMRYGDAPNGYVFCFACSIVISFPKI